MDPKVDEYLNQAEKWGAEMAELRRIAIDCGLTETVKWKQPCYMYHSANVAIVSSLKAKAMIGFFKGALLSNNAKMLVRPGENSHHTMYLPFTSVADIMANESIIKAHIFEAIEVEKAGLKVDSRPAKNLAIPNELEGKFEEFPDLKVAFESLTPGRQSGYLLYFNGAKQTKTRVSRIEKYIPRILNGKGFHDCVCGHSKRMPTCDGSHKYL